MAKKQESKLTEGMEMPDLVTELMKGTNFSKSNDTNVLSQRIKVETPLIVVNCILGGGTPLGCVLESFGFPKSGKSTWLYQTLSKFQAKYPNGLGLILDNESSADDSRLEFFGVDTSRTLRLPSSSIESGFLNLLQILENKSKSEQARQMPIFIIWDSISKGLAQDGATQSRMNAQDRARVIKNYMSPVMTEIEKHPMVLNLINQVVFETDRYGNRKVKSGGGVGLEHDVHLKVKTELANKDEWNGTLLVGRYSRLDITKSKLSPEVYDIPIFIDLTNGGKIDEIRSFLDYLVNIGMIPNLSGYYKIEGTLVPKYRFTPYYRESVAPYWKAYRYANLVDDLRANPHTIDFLKLALMDYFGEIYKLQKSVMHDYYVEVSEKYASESNVFEFKLLRDQEVLANTLAMLDSNKDVLLKLLEYSKTESLNPVCLKCSSPLEYHLDCPTCKVDYVVSKSALSYLLNQYVEVVGEIIPSTPEVSSEVANPTELISESEVVSDESSTQPNYEDNDTPSASDEE